MSSSVSVLYSATNPSQFKVEFFVNDLGKPCASRFESIGGFEYKENGNIHLECDRRVSPLFQTISFQIIPCNLLIEGILSYLK